MHTWYYDHGGDTILCSHNLHGVRRTTKTDNYYGVLTHGGTMTIQIFTLFYTNIRILKN